MEHYYKYESMSEEDRNGLIPFMHVPEALRIDPEDREPQCDTQPKKTPSGRHAGPRNGYVRKTRDVYVLTANYGQGWAEEKGEGQFATDNWQDMKTHLDRLRRAEPKTRFSYRRKRIKIEQ